MVLCYVVVFGRSAYSPNWMGIHVLGVGLSVVTIRKFKIFGLEIVGAIAHCSLDIDNLAVGYTYLW